MRYTIVTKTSVFYTDYYSYDNTYFSDITCIIDNMKYLYSFNGIDWIEVEFDML